MTPKTKSVSIASRASRRRLPDLLQVLLAFLLASSVAFGATATLSWNKGPEPDLAGYVLYWGKVGTTTTNSRPIFGASNTNGVATNLAVGDYCWFYVVSSNLAGITSAPSEVLLSSIMGAGPTNLVLRSQSTP